MDGSASGRRGRIEVVTGCMFSGKTERLLARRAEALRSGLRLAVFKHASDDRYAAAELVAHSGRRAEAIPVTTPADIRGPAAQAELVLVDEAQFFGPDLVDVCRALAAQGREVVVAGLDRDSAGRPFGPMEALMAVADTVTRLRAVCPRCGQPAEFTQRLTPVVAGRMVGGPEAYAARCRDCFEPWSDGRGKRQG